MGPKPQLRPEVVDVLVEIMAAARAEAGVTVTAVARGAGLDTSAISRLETADVMPADLDAVVSAYAELTRSDPVRLWRQAVDEWGRRR